MPVSTKFEVIKTNIKRDFFINELGQTRYPNYQAQLDHGLKQAKRLGADAVFMFEDPNIKQYISKNQPGAIAYAATLLKYR